MDIPPPFACDEPSPSYSSDNGRRQMNYFPMDDSLGIIPPLKPVLPKYMLEVSRLQTFSNYPLLAPQKPEDLAKAGFIYLGTGDKVKCFCCNGNLMNWDAEDDPFIEHARWFPKCGYIKLIKGPDFIKSAGGSSAQEQNELKNSFGINLPTSTDPGCDQMPSTKMQAVMELGYSQNSIEKEMRKKGKGLDDFTDAEDLMSFMLSSDVETSLIPEGMSEEEITAMLNEEEPLEMRFDTPDEKNLVNSNTADVKNIVSENKDMKEQLLCKICLEENANIVFLPCGHLVTCGVCASSLKNCPFCRKTIKGTVRTYLA